MSLSQASQFPVRWEEKVTRLPSALTDGHQSVAASWVRRCGSPKAFPRFASAGRLQMSSLETRLAKTTDDPATAGWVSSAVPKVSRWGAPATFQVLSEMGIRQRFVLSPRTYENVNWPS